MYRFRFSAPFLLLVALATSACPKPEDSAGPNQSGTQQAGQAQDGQTYTIRFIFAGLVTFVTPDRSTDPGKLWVLVGNATNPGGLTVGRGIAPHNNRLMIEHTQGVRISGRTLEDLGNGWRGVTLRNEDLRLEGDLRTPLTVVRGTGRSPHPCIPQGSNCTPEQSNRQREDFEWIIDADEALARVQTQNPNPQHRELRGCLVEETYSCPNEAPLLSARLKLDKGRTFVHELFKNERNRFITYNFGSRFPFDPRAAAREVAVKIDAVGPVRLVSNPLNGSGGRIDPIVVDADLRQTVTIRLGNHPTCRDCRTQPDFLFHFNLINNPRFVQENGLPFPVPILQNDRSGLILKPDEFDPQCSPGGFVGGI